MVKNRMSWLVFIVSGAGFLASNASATPISISGPYHFLDHRSDNSIGLVSGQFQQFGAISVSPNGSAGTAGVANQAGITRQLNHFDLSVNPNFYAGSMPAAVAPDGPWTLTFTNGVDTATAITPDIRGATLVPFVDSLAISGNGASPSFNWTVPTSFAPDAIRVQIRDTTSFIGKGGVGGIGLGDIIYVNSFAGNTTNFAVSPTDPLLTRALLDNHTYSLEIQLLDTRNNSVVAGLPNVLSMSRSFFDFTLLPPGAPPNVFLPTLVPGAAPYYSFNVHTIVGGTVSYFDPLVSTGFDYMTGDGDPNFASVLLPFGIGDNLYELFLWNGTEYVDSGFDLTGGLEFDFLALDPAGFDRFRVIGIEESAGLDPNDTTAFITGLSFTRGGQFTGTMTPLVVRVPEPSTLVLTALALGLLGLSRGSTRGNSPREGHYP